MDSPATTRPQEPLDSSGPRSRDGASILHLQGVLPKVQGNLGRAEEAQVTGKPSSIMEVTRDPGNSCPKLATSETSTEAHGDTSPSYPSDQTSATKIIGQGSLFNPFPCPKKERRRETHSGHQMAELLSF